VTLKFGKKTVIPSVLMLSLIAIVFLALSQSLTSGFIASVDLYVMYSGHYTESSIMSHGLDSVGVKLVALPPPLKQIVITLYFLISPFPPFGQRKLYSEGVCSIFAGLGAIYWYIFAVFWVIGMFYCIRERNYGNILLFFINAVFLILIANSTRHIRHKLQMMPFAFIVAGYGVTCAKQMRYKSLVMNIYKSIYVVITIMYLLLKARFLGL